MPDVLTRLIPKRWRVGVEVLVFLVAGWALLAQIGCQTQEFAKQGVIFLRDVEFRPAFVVADQSPPATTRYWVGANHSISVRWGQIISDPPGCNVCDLQNCREPLPVFVSPPVIVVGFRSPMGDDVHEAPPLSYELGCGMQSWGAIFFPGVPMSAEERKYRASIQFEGGDLIPAEPADGFPIRIIPKKTEMPPRRLIQRPDALRTWRWPERYIPEDSDRSSPFLTYEAVDPNLQVGKVKIVKGTCDVRPPELTPPTPGEPLSPGDERHRYECADDQFMDANFQASDIVVPYRITVVDEMVTGRDGVEYQRCESVVGQSDGGIDLGRVSNDAQQSRCFENSAPRPFRPMTPFFLSDIASGSRRRLLWKVEFDAEKGFPPPDPGTELWIIFTLEPLQ